MRALLPGVFGRPASFPAAVVAVACLLGPAPAPAAPLRPAPAVVGLPEGSRVNRHDGTGLVRFLAAPPGQALAGPDRVAVGPEAQARSFLAARAELFGIADQARELALLRASDARGRRTVRFRQLASGLPVLGGELVVRLDERGGVLSVNAETVPADGVPTEPAVTAAAAVSAAVAVVAAARRLPATQLIPGVPALWVYNPTVFTPELFANYLVWRLDVGSPSGLFRELVLVDASTGAVLLHFNQIDSARNRMTHDMGHSSDPDALPGVFVCGEADPACAAGDADAAAAHRFAGDAYDYFSGRFGRDGIDGAGMTITSSVHFGSGYENAFWTGSQMVYGDGFAAADDVVGHELAHGVTERTCNLFYWLESGAISESLSDVHGELIDLTNAAGTDDPASRWQLGEDLPPSVGVIRNMADPTLFGDPDRIGSDNYYTGMADNGGVHTNSGVNNKAATLLADGGGFNGRSVGALGLDKVALLYYEVQARYLTPASNHADLRDALLDACGQLASAGTGGFVADDCAQVQSAVDAVEMGLLPGQRAIDDGSPAFRWTGAWSNPRDPWALFGRHHVSRRVGNTASLIFTGARVTFHFLPQIGGGTVDLVVDGVRKATVTTNRAAVASMSWEYHLTGLTAGRHRLVLRHSSGGPVSVDAVVARGRAETLPARPQADFSPGVVFWAGSTTWLKYSGYWWVFDLAASYRTGDKLIWSFVGERYRVVFVGGPSAVYGTFQVLVDGKLARTVSTRRAVDGLYSVTNGGTPLPRRLHTVAIRHAAGSVVAIVGVAGYDTRAAAGAGVAGLPGYQRVRSISERASRMSARAISQ